MDARLDRPQRHPGHLGDLAVVIALDVVEDDRRALVVRDPGQRHRDGSAPLGVDRGSFGIGLLTCGWLPALVLELGVRLDRRRFRARWVSIAALTQIRLSHDLTLPPRNESRLR